MGFFKNVVEPAAIALAFTAGTIINRRRTKLHAAQTTHTTVRDIETLPEVLSWICATFPFLKEVWYWLLTYWIYQLSRAFSARIIAPHPQIYLLAKQHALQLLSIEHALGIDIEQSLQAYILTRHPGLMPVLRQIYQSHIIVGVVFIVYTYTVLPTPLFRRIRRTIAMDNLIAFVIVSLWRCYPPRMLPPEFGFVDILHASKPASVWTDNRFRLTIAAMPSLHFGTSLFFAVCLARFSPHVLVRVLAPLWPLAMFVTVVATANHFVLDLVAGAVVPLLGWRWNRALLVLEGVQDWVFAPVVERMDPKTGVWK
ncbi:hypothetical protein BBK36DRAFT_143812 [Trichoderma citrinoviride]|uniref:Inositolphosphotransferase Aur1/Ipt1 domain-containing protein n=1 Tax=Trichoderma citrinoviride TaxID=58853 RepID=A0A2T4B2Y9_9HYPO|nr:hypothetical protein BBK36DRAFT_143812 [Trichoderma citrinoviride]PTB63696.1 hypothetical protein BBK36DRAFT_143812 [Trichoderma citrinoviride]